MREPDVRTWEARIAHFIREICSGHVNWIKVGHDDSMVSVSTAISH
jgi:hypothetical protein